MTYAVGGTPGSVFTETDLVQGKCPQPGQYFSMVDSQGSKGFYLCRVTASQNLTNGHLVTIDADFTATIVAIAGPGANLGARNCGVAVVSATASASTLIWVQVLGRGNVQASLSALPFVVLKVGSVAGNVDDDVTSSASGVIDNIVLTVTSGLAAALCACMLTFPKFGPSPVSA